MNNLFESFTEFKDAKNINRQEIMNILEDVFRSTLIKKYGSDEWSAFVLGERRDEFYYNELRECYKQ